MSEITKKNRPPALFFIEIQTRDIFSLFGLTKIYFSCCRETTLRVIVILFLLQNN